MVEFLVSIINLFFVPMVSLTIHQRTVRKQNASCKRDLIMQYCVYTALNVPAVKTIATIIRLIGGRAFGAASGFYTLAGLAVAAMLPWAVVLIRKFFSVTFEVKRNEKT